MDKWTIMDAFKSLDEKLEEKKMLKESISVHEALDLDEAQNEWLHQRGVVAGGDDIDSIGEITGIEDLGNNFDSTVFDFTLDDGKVLTLNGKDIKLNLQEKMPKDLAKAYACFQRRVLSDGSIVGLYDPKSPHAPNDFEGSWRYRNKARKLPRTSSAVRDWENSTYIEISKKEALKLPTSEKHKLRVIVNSDSDYPKLFMWDVNGKLITETQYSGIGGNFKDIIEASDKIYLADEPFIQKRIDNDNRTLTADQEKDTNLSLTADSNDMRAHTLVNKAANALAASGSKKYYRDYPDTGAHDMDRQIGGDYNTYRRVLRDYKELVSKIKHADSLSAEQLAKLNSDLEDSKRNVDFWYDSWLSDKRSLARQRAVNVKPVRMNLDLARLICYKKLLADAKQKGDDIYNNKFSSEYRDMVNRRDDLIVKIAEMQKELKGLQSALPGAKKQYEELVETKLEGILAECEGYATALKDLRTKHGLVKEGLGNDCVFRIYTEKDGAEDFIDDVPVNKDDAVKYAESLYGDYDVVTLCSLCGDDVEIVRSSADLDEDISKPTLGEIVDARLGEDNVQKESLTEDSHLQPIPPGTTIVLLATFKRQSKDLKITDDDIEDLKKQLTQKAPEAALGNHIYKFRFAPPSWNTGKRGATRVIYIEFIKDSCAYLVSIYAKNQKEDLNDAEVKTLKKLSKALENAN